MTAMIVVLSVFVLLMLAVLVDQGAEIAALRRGLNALQGAVRKVDQDSFRRDEQGQQLSKTIVWGQGRTLDRIQSLEERMDRLFKRDAAARESEINGRLDAADGRSE